MFIQYIPVSRFEARVTFFKEEKPGNSNKIGVREHRHPLVCFFDKLFGLAVDVRLSGKVICLKKNSLRKWIQSNLEQSESRCHGNEVKMLNSYSR